MLGSGRFLCKRVDSLPKVFNATPSLRQCVSSAHSEGKIVIPKRIERRPTDILEALSSTVNVDPTGFHYKFHDDPYFYAYSVIDKKVYALAKESGRKSAEWIVKENPKFFMSNLAEPPIKAFEALTVSREENELSEQGLLNAIEERNVPSAIEIYKNLKSKGMDVQKSTKQSLLELVCFFNSEEKPNLDLEEKWLQRFLGKAGGNITTEKRWNSEFAESLYEEMDPGCPLALSAMIQGKLRYKEPNAMMLFEEAVNQKLKLPVNVYNCVLQEAYYTVRKANTLGFVKKLLHEMEQQNVKPNLGTLNGALKALSKTSLMDFSIKLIKEFISIGIKPSLGSYGCLFRIAANLDSSDRDEKNSVYLVFDIFDKIENEEHEILHPVDFSFFPNAVRAFSEGPNFRNGNLLLRLHDMYLKPGNRKFVVSGWDDHWFYKYFIPLLFETQPIDVAMDFYRTYKFTLITLQTDLAKGILIAIKENFGVEFLPDLWRDFHLMRCSESRPILEIILPMVKDFTDQSCRKIFHEAAMNFLKVMQNRRMEGDEDTIPFVLLALLNNEDEKELEKTLTWIRDTGILFKNMKESIVQSVFDFGMDRKNSTILLGSLSLAEEERMSTLDQMVEKALPLLSGDDKAWASGLLDQGKKSQKNSRKPSNNETEIPGDDV